MKKLFGCLALLGICLSANAQIVKSQVVENGGSGEYPAIVVAEESLPTHTVYRPKDLKATVEKQGKLPVIVYANGACFNKGQSCGGSQVLGVAHDPRIKTCVMLNTGIGDMEMSGASKENLKNVHTSMFYMIGGPTDIAHQNANKDFARLENVPIVMFNSHDGHNGTYYEKNGGAYAFLVTRWLDWQLKGMTSKCGIFLDDDYAKMMFPTWTFERKNF